MAAFADPYSGLGEGVPGQTQNDVGKEEGLAARTRTKKEHVPGSTSPPPFLPSVAGGVWVPSDPDRPAR